MEKLGFLLIFSFLGVLSNQLWVFYGIHGVWVLMWLIGKLGTSKGEILRTLRLSIWVFDE